MRLAEGVDVRINITDIETLAEMTYVGCYDPDTQEWFEFELSRRKNDILKFVDFYLSHPKHEYMVTFNGVDFDQVVLQYIIRNYEGWYDLTGEEIAKLVYKFVQRHLDDRKYNIKARYNESDFSMNALDLFKIHHFDNDAKRTSLKWCEFMMCMMVEEMPIHHSAKGLTDQQMDEVITYCKHDIKATLGLLYLTLGQIDRIKELNNGVPVDHLSEYKGKNKIQDRFDVMKETGLLCLNWSDVKIGEEWNKLDYMKATGVTDEKVLIDDKAPQPFGKKFKKFFPKTMKFKTHHVNDFVKEIGNNYVLPEKQEFNITIGKTDYTIAKGGIHSTEKDRFIIPPKGWKLRDADVGSQYPNSIVKLGIFPHILDPIILQQFQGKIKKRIEYKTNGNKLKGVDDVLARLYMSVQEMLKLCLNGGYYGKLGQKGSFLYCPEGLLKVCMGNQMEILMLIEMMELAGFQVVSGNTDGIVTMFPEDREDLYKSICKEWEQMVGNHELGKLEYADYAGIWQCSINNYIAKDTSGKIKKKGNTFSTEMQLHRNKSKRIIPLALEQYFIHGKDPAEFIRSHKNIHDFTIAVKASGDMHYEEQWEEDGQLFTKKHKKLVVYYISTEGTILYKRGFNHKGKPMNNHCEAQDTRELGQPLVKYFNVPYTVEDFADYKIDYNYYIFEVLKVIDSIEKTRRTKKFLESLRPVYQAALFDF